MENKNLLKYAIYRILGNDIPIRDNLGDRLKCCKFIIENEPILMNCDKYWVLNRFYNKKTEKEFTTLCNNNTIVNSFNFNEYRKNITENEKILYAVNPNIGRNLAIKDGFYKGYDFILILDGECFFTLELWEETLSQLETNNDIIYGVLNMHRATFNNWKDALHKTTEEPQIGFKLNAKIKFDETIAFGNDDKNELLRRVGLTRKTYETTYNQTKYIGSVIHVSPGYLPAVDERIKSRKVGLSQLLKNIELHYQLKLL